MFQGLCLHTWTVHSNSVSFCLSLPPIPPSLSPPPLCLSPACACVHTHTVNELNFLRCEECVCTWAYVLKFRCRWILVGMRIQDVYHLAKSQHSVILSLINRWLTGFHKEHCVFLVLCHLNACEGLHPLGLLCLDVDSSIRLDVKGRCFETQDLKCYFRVRLHNNGGCGASLLICSQKPAQSEARQAGSCGRMESSSSFSEKAPLTAATVGESPTTSHTVEADKTKFWQKIKVVVVPSVAVAWLADGFKVYTS